MSGTEAADPHYAGIEGWTPDDVVAALVEAQQAGIAALVPVQAALAAAAGAVAARLRAGGRLIYVGAGTSGRLAALDAAELPPTFGWPAERAVALVAGGPGALLRAVEGAEDDTAAAEAMLSAMQVGARDAVIGIAASGATPFTCAALKHARAAGALTLGLFNTPGAPMADLCDHPLPVLTGAEAVAGSTRMKAGTAQKAALTCLSTAVMLQLGLVHRGRMVAMRPTNAKLRRRAVAMVADLTGCDAAVAATALVAAHDDIRCAVAMLALGIDATAATARLAAADGDLGRALADPDDAPPRA